MEPRKLLIQLCPINHKTCRRSCYLVIITPEGTSTHATHLFLGKVCHSILKQDYVGTLKHLAKHIIAFAAVSCWLKALGICAEGLWIRAEFLYNIRWQEEHPTHKLSLVHLHSELQARVLPLRGIINFYSPWNHKRTADFRGNRS